MTDAHEKTRIRQLEDAATHWEHKYTNARQYNRNLEERCQKLEAALRGLFDEIDSRFGSIADMSPELLEVMMKAKDALVGEPASGATQDRGAK